MNKKAAWEWEEIAKFLLLIIILVIIIVIIFYLKERGFNLGEKIINLLRFS